MQTGAAGQRAPDALPRRIEPGGYAVRGLWVLRHQTLQPAQGFQLLLDEPASSRGATDTTGNRPALPCLALPCPCPCPCLGSVGARMLIGFQLLGFREVRHSLHLGELVADPCNGPTHLTQIGVLALQAQVAVRACPLVQALGQRPPEGE